MNTRRGFGVLVFVLAISFIFTYTPLTNSKTVESSQAQNERYAEVFGPNFEFEVAPNDIVTGSYRISGNTQVYSCMQQFSENQKIVAVNTVKISNSRLEFERNYLSDVFPVNKCN